LAQDVAVFVMAVDLDQRAASATPAPAAVDPADVEVGGDRGAGQKVDGGYCL
jgi:hypothetical protein